MATNQAIQRLAAQPRRGARQAVLLAVSVSVVLALALAFAVVGPHSTGRAAADRAANDAFVQVRRDEREERYAPSVEDVRRALIQFRKDEREDR